MKISDIYNLLENNFEVNQFIQKYWNEYYEYKKRIENKTSSIPVVIEDDFSFTFTERHLISICIYFLSDKLSELQINYIVDCLTLSETVVYNDASLLEKLESFTDPYVNGHLTKAYIKDLLNDLGRSKYDL